MATYQIKNPQKFNDAEWFTIDCYFDRAIRFKPTDGVVYMIKGIYLYKIGKTQVALDAYLKALQFLPDSTELHYNIGLIYFKLKKYDKARIFAQKAYDKKFPLPGLREKLIKIGKWKTTKKKPQSK